MDIDRLYELYREVEEGSIEDEGYWEMHQEWQEMERRLEDASLYRRRHLLQKHMLHPFLMTVIRGRQAGIVEVSDEGVIRLTEDAREKLNRVDDEKVLYLASLL